MTALGFNPHLLPQTTQTTTRAALHDEEGKAGNLSSRREEELAAETKLLDRLVQQSIGSFDICPANVAAKKRKLGADSPKKGETSVAAPFRLVSSVLPPQPISLLPAHHCSIPHQRPMEDTLDEERQRQMQAQEVAVDANWIIEHLGADNPWGYRAVAKTLNPISPGIDPSHLPNLLVTERTRAMANTRLAKGGGIDVIRSCPLLAVTDPAQNDKPHKRKRRRKTTPRDRPPPRFFRPMQDWGGKSAGYAMGWQGSWPVRGSESHGYVRDKMRNG